MFQNKFTQNIIKALNKFITKKLTQKLYSFFDLYFEYNHTDEISLNELNGILKWFNHYLNDKFESLFEGLSSAEFNDNYGEFKFYGVKLFEKYDDDKGFVLDINDITEILTAPEFSNINKFIEWQ